ncbi:hypothetical protein E5288_WYG021714 [Bos mutus]|uniref:Uncharacterized protein n=1 Tax=Bos mutus TaxID=72004 RepID=A0A6B0RQK1_9CETA|nr:hypothetical protein [Bos mutus]
MILKELTVLKTGICKKLSPSSTTDYKHFTLCEQLIVTWKEEMFSMVLIDVYIYCEVLPQEKRGNQLHEWNLEKGTVNPTQTGEDKA